MASDQPLWMEVEVVDSGDPPLGHTVRFPVFVMDPLDGPTLERTNVKDQQIQMAWRVEPGMAYQVLYAENIRHPVWLPLTAPREVIQPRFEVTDKLHDDRPRFYRMVQLEKGSRRK